MMKVRIARNDFESLMAHLHQNGLEQHAFLLADRCGDSLVVRETIRADPRNDVATQSPVFIALRPLYPLEALERAKAYGLHLIDVHSHPFCGAGVAFSSTDHRSARDRFAWHLERCPEMVSAGLVFGRRSAQGMARRPHSCIVEPIEAVEIAGRSFERWASAGPGSGEACRVEERYDRQARAFGAEGQAAIASLRVAVVGLGGTGSALVTQLAHLGVKDWILIDPDRVELSNLNRLVGGRAADARCGMRKTGVATRVIRSLHRDAVVDSVPEPVDSPRAITHLSTADFIFGCGDNAGVRAVLCRTAADLLIPYIDLGSGIHAANGTVTDGGGQVFAHWPGGPCLNCWRPIDGVAAAVALRSNAERAAHEGVYGTPEPQASVIAINSVVASVAAGEFLKYASRWSKPESCVVYDAMRGTVAPLSVERRHDCEYCSPTARPQCEAQCSDRFVAEAPIA